MCRTAKRREARRQAGEGGVEGAWTPSKFQPRAGTSLTCEGDEQAENNEAGSLPRMWFASFLAFLIKLKVLSDNQHPRILSIGPSHSISDT